MASIAIMETDRPSPQTVSRVSAVISDDSGPFLDRVIIPFSDDVILRGL